jgi:hypothetical protein
MTNPYAEFVTPPDNTNPYAAFAQSPTIDENEQDIVSRTNNPRVETPTSFGLVEFPANIARGLDQSILSIPKDFGSTLVEAGELSQAVKGDGVVDTAKQSIAKRLFDYVEKNEQMPGLFGSVKMFYGAGKDAFLNTVSDGAAPKALIDAGNAMMTQNDAALNALGLAPPKDGALSYDIGQGVGSVLKSIGAAYIAKNPAAAGAMMTWTVNSSDYQEARNAGKSPEEAAQIAGISALGQGKVEGIGMGVFQHLSATSGFFKKVLFRAAEQSLEETAQGVIEETVKGVSEVRDTDFNQKMHNVLYQGALGFIVGAPVSGVYTLMEDSAKAQGLNPDEIKDSLDKFVENKDDVINGAAEMLYKEASGITNTEADQKKVLEAIKAVEMPKVQVRTDKPEFAEQAQVDGEPLRITVPNINAQKDAETLTSEADMLDSLAAENETMGDPETAALQKDMAVERRAQAAAIAEPLQVQSAARSNEAISPIMEQEKAAQRKQLENIQSETDDISLNLLREVTTLQEDKAIVDPELKAIFEDTASLLNERRKTPKPVSLIEFLKQRGGVKETGGELQNMGMRNRSSARNDKTGIELDAAREAAAEAGYIDVDSTVADFLVALENDFKTPNSVIAEKDVGIQSKLDEIDSVLVKLDEALDRSGLGTYSRERLGELRRRVAENKKLDKATAREIKMRESELQKLESARREAEKSPPRILADKLKTFISGLREGTYLGRYEALDVQNKLIDMIEQSGLDANDRAKFIRTIKNTQTIEQLQNKMPEVIERVEQLVDKAKRRAIVDKIKSALSTARDSNIIAVDFVNRIEDLVSEIDTQGRTEKTINSLQRTLDYLNRNPIAEMPKRILNKLEILNKKPLDEVTTDELQSILDGVNDLVKKGKLKFELLQRKQQRLKEKRIEALEKSSVPISEVNVSRAPIGERLNAMDSAKNKWRQFQNKAKRIGVATNPMDVFFDMLDGGKNYLGENYKIFKKTIDKSFSNYLNLKESVTRDVKNLADKLNLDALNFEKIGAWAVLQQEGGEKKLLDSGITQAEIDGLQLDAFEMQMYKLMREKLDEMLPSIQQVMREVYNKDVVAVSDYFPFMTDHDAMSGTPIEDQFGPNVPSIAKKKNVEKGFTVSRTLGSQKVRIDALGVFMRHVDNAAYLIEMGKDIKQLGDVAQTSEYKSAVGDIGQQMVVEWINLLARKGNLPGRIPLVDMLRRNVGVAVLGFKLSSALIQPTALADGATLVGGNYVADGVFKVATSKEWRQFLWKNFPEIRERAGDDQAYLDMGGDSKLGQIREAGFWALKNIDALIASSIATGAYIKSIENKGGNVDLNNPDKEAIQEAQMLMRRTQSSAFAKDTPALLSQGTLTGNVSLDKLIFQFQSFMFNRWSLIKHDMWELGIKEREFGKAVNIATWLILANLAEIGIRRLSKEIVSAVAGDEEDPWEETITKEMMLTTLGNVPFVSQAVNAFEYGSVPVPAFGAMDKITKQMMWAAQSDDEDVRLQHFASAFTLAMGTAFGIPGTIQAESLLRKSLKDE